MHIASQRRSPHHFLLYVVNKTFEKSPQPFISRRRGLSNHEYRYMKNCSKIGR